MGSGILEVRAVGMGDAMGASTPTYREENDSQDAGKVDFNNLIFSTFPGEKYPWIPPRHSCFRCFLLPMQNPAYCPGGDGKLNKELV